MIYMGSKARIAKSLLEIMLKDIGDNYFVDCFTGGGNLIQFATCKNKIANDINPYVISFFRKLQKDGTEWLPKNSQEFTEQDYYEIKANKEKYDLALLGHVGYNLSYGGKWFNSPRRDKIGKRDYVAEAYRGACKQLEKIKDVKFYNYSYEKLGIPENSVIYCDIPYKNTGKYQALAEPFDYEKFYKWCRDMKAKGHIIFVSEYSMPEDFICIWEKELKVQVACNSNSIPSTERLFTLR